MSVLDTKNRRKSAGITITVLLVLLYLIFNYGMDYIDPPVEYGIALTMVFQIKAEPNQKLWKT